MLIDTIIFDCDGVLIDSEAVSCAVLTEALARLGVVIDVDHFCAHYVGRSFGTVAAEIEGSFGVTLPETFEADYRTALLARFESSLSPTPGIAAVLDDLTLDCCVATSSSPERVARSLAITDLAGWFGERVFTASEVARGKPAPDLFLHAARRMDTVPERCLVIEDSLPGIAAARAAGMAVLRYTGGGHLAGRELKHDADIVVFDNWAEFPLMLAGLQGDGSEHGQDTENQRRSRTIG